MVNQNLMIKLSADTSNYTTKLAAASAQARSLGTALEAPRTTGQKVDGVLTNIGVAAGVMATAIGVSAVKTFADFDAQMSVVQANTGAAAGGMNSLRDAALDAGARTVYSASEAAGAINELAKAGMSTADILNGGLNGALDLAASDGMAVSEAAELMSSTMAQFNLTGADSTKVADALAAGAGKALGSAHDLGYALAQTGTIANNYGISMEETTGTLAAFAKQGRIGSDAGTSLKSMLLRLSNQTPKVKKEMDKLGLSAYDSSGQFVGLANFAGQLQDKLSGLTPEQRDAAMAIMFGSDAVQSANILYKEGKEGIQNWTKEVSESGFAAEQAAARNNNLKGDIEQLGGSVETALIKIGSGANGPLRAVTQSITDVVNAFADLDPHVQQTVVLLGGVIGAGAGLHKVFGNLASSTSKTGQAFSLAMDPVERFKTGLPQLRDGFSLIAGAATGSSTGIDSMSGAATRGQVAMSGLKNVGSGVVGLLGGPLGIALTVASIAIGFFAKKQQDAKRATEELSAELSSGADAVTVFVKKIESGNDTTWDFGDQFMSGAGDLKDQLDKVGITYEEFALAATGAEGAQEKFNKKLRDADWSVDRSSIISSLDDYKESLKEAEKQQELEKKATEATKAANVDASLAAAGLAEATTDSAEASSEAADSADILEQRMGATTKGVNDQASALGEVISALDTYYGFALSAFDADTKLADSFDKATESVKKNGATLDENTDKGRENRGAISDLVDSVTASAEAHARNGESLEDVNKIMDDGRQKVIEMAKAMGLSEQDAAAFADQMGLSQEAVDGLVNSVSDASDMKITISDDATKKLENIKLKAETLPDGKKVTITGENKDALQKIADVVGAKVDDKNTSLTLNKDQFDIALALANGATIDPKTGLLYGDNDPMWRELMEANGWTIDPKTGAIKGNKEPMRAALNEVKNWPINFNKSIRIVGDPSPLNALMARIRRQPREEFHVGVSALPGTGNATGGYIRGPGTATSDSIPSWLSNGEYVIRAAAVRKIGVKNLDHLNAAGFANGGLVQNLQAVPTAMQVSMNPSPTKFDSGQGKVTYLQTVNLKMYGTGASSVDAQRAASRIRASSNALISMNGM